MIKKQNPLAGFWRVGCIVFSDRQGTNGCRIYNIASLCFKCKFQQYKELI